MSRFALFAASFLAVISVAAGGAGGTRAGVPRLRVKGAQIVDGEGRTVRLRGVAFGNEVWGNVRVPRRHHAEVDYQRVAAMGMNAVRFYMNYRTFEPIAAPTSGSSSGSASSRARLSRGQLRDLPGRGRAARSVVGQRQAHRPVHAEAVAATGA